MMESGHEMLLEYVLHLADNSMILGQRNSEWCGHGPVLEQDIALTNIALDLIGEARSLYQYAAQLKGNGASEDSVAFIRDVLEYKNALLAEQPNTDWAHSIMRQFFYDAFHYYLQEDLINSADERIREIAAKTIKEAKYHLKWSSEWTIRLGDGTALSHDKMQDALNNLWPYTGELFTADPCEILMEQKQIGANLETVREKWQSKVSEILAEATLIMPEGVFMQTGGKSGRHTEHMGFMLAEMQYLQRAYPGAEW